MKTAIISLTKNGGVTAVKIEAAIGGDLFCRVPPEDRPETALTKPLKELMKEIFGVYDRFVMIMAAGIAVRSVAPLIRKKDRDPAVVVMDEKGVFAISLLSGHLGGANELAREIEAKTGAKAVITTATDVNGIIAFDMVAKKNRCAIENLNRLAGVSAALVNGGAVTLRCDLPLRGELPPNLRLTEKGGDVAITNRVTADDGERLLLRPKNLVLGVGCRRNTPFEPLSAALDTFLKETGYAPLSVAAMASADLKKDEPGLKRLSEERSIPFFTYPADALAEAAAASETASAFVAEVTGTPSVSEAAALLHSGGRTVVKKTIVNGVTFSLAEIPAVIVIETE